MVPAEHRIAHRATDERQLVTCGREASTEVVDERRDPVELLRHGALDVDDLERGWRCVGHGRRV